MSVRIPSFMFSQPSDTHISYATLEGVKIASSTLHGCQLVSISETELIVTGGESDGLMRKVCESIDTISGNITSLPNMHFAKVNHCSVGVSAKRILTIGGEGEKSVLKTSEMYDPKTKNWRSIPPLLEPRHSACVCALDDLVFIFGGRELPGDSGKVHKTCEFLDATLGRPIRPWTTLKPMKQARANAFAVAWQGKMWIVGGTSGVKPLPTVEIYDPIKKCWTDGPSLNHARADPLAFVSDSNNAIVVVGGRDPTTRKAITSVEISKNGGPFEIVSEIESGHADFNLYVMCAVKDLPNADLTLPSPTSANGLVVMRGAAPTSLTAAANAMSNYLSNQQQGEEVTARIRSIDLSGAPVEDGFSAPKGMKNLMGKEEVEHFEGDFASKNKNVVGVSSISAQHYRHGDDDGQDDLSPAVEGQMNSADPMDFFY